ncbi:hypothetical protein MHYP_G00157590 [Metynnis hypsauchen]
MRNKTQERLAHRGGRAKGLTERLRRHEHAEALRLCSGVTSWRAQARWVYSFFPTRFRTSPALLAFRLARSSCLRANRRSSTPILEQEGGAWRKTGGKSVSRLEHLLKFPSRIPSQQLTRRKSHHVVGINVHTNKDQEHKSAFQRMAGHALDIPGRNMLLYPHDPNQIRSPNGL